MKSVLRSVFDPVPRPLSPGAQLLVVGVLVVGITISVLEYLESSQPGSVAQDPLRAPARQEVGWNVRAPSETASRSRSLVRAAPRPVTPASVPTSGAVGQPSPSSFGREPGAAAAAPMSFQPGEDG
jgi:hypothetical protein